ncbi:polysaccharide biosynthesis/export family protein [Lutibacter sp.]|uniref:polysaccharide biosynthesis/export family protein n=1 Tax=Lutibacter sp. TaxID=1925666 RepID=UPI0038CDB149
MVYFQTIEGQELQESIVNYEPKFQIGDLLTINVSAIDAEAVIPFNLFESTSVGTPKPIAYLVDADGDINFPVIGKIKIEGLTSKELTKKLSTLIAVYVKQPIINSRLINFKVTVLGEVKVPGSYAVPNERISIIEAIGLAGDLTIQGERSTVLLVREQEGKRTFIDLDLTNKKLFNSPYFYLAQNDVIYIAPNKTKINSSGVGTNTSILISSISALISLIAILTR